MSIEKDIGRIATALETLAKSAQQQLPGKIPTTEPPAVAANDEAPAEVAQPEVASTDADRADLQSAIAQLVSDEANVPKAKEILATFHGALKISDLTPDEYPAVTAKINAYYLTLPA